MNVAKHIVNERSGDDAKFDVREQLASLALRRAFAKSVISCYSTSLLTDNSVASRVAKMSARLIEFTMATFRLFDSNCAIRNETISDRTTSRSTINSPNDAYAKDLSLCYAHELNRCLKSTEQYVASLIDCDANSDRSRKLQTIQRVTKIMHRTVNRITKLSFAKRAKTCARYVDFDITENEASSKRRLADSKGCETSLQFEGDNDGNNEMESAIARTETLVPSHNVVSWICFVCHRRFEKTFHYLQHVRMHYRLNLYRCSVCGESFVQQNGLNYHVENCVVTRGNDATSSLLSSPSLVSSKASSASSLLSQKYRIELELCNSCGKVYERGVVMRRHVVRRHARHNIDIGINRDQQKQWKAIVQQWIRCNRVQLTGSQSCVQ